MSENLKRSLFDVDAYDYDLPEGLIAQNPAEPRDSSRLLVLDRSGSSLQHSTFACLDELLKPGDLLVLNNTRVIQARLRGIKVSGGARVEVLLLKPLSEDWRCWEALVRPGRKLQPGQDVLLPGGETLKVGERLDEGVRKISFNGSENVRSLLSQHGEMPLPPYITKTDAPPERYQTVYATEEGSAAAPTAGLHFTEALFERLHKKGIRKAWVTLHVGLGTFRPVKVSDIRQHPMHEELCFVPPETVSAISETRRRGGRVVAVGTTVVRTLESLAAEKGVPRSGYENTRLFIYPGYTFRVVDVMLTNFHLPKSTLLMLVSAFAGYEQTMQAYRTAVGKEYRFFSFGDAMLIL